MGECKDWPATSTVDPISNLIQRTPDEQALPTKKAATTTTNPLTGESSHDSSKNEIKGLGETTSSFQAANYATEETNSGIFFPSSRVPYPSHHQLLIPPELSLHGSTAIHVSSAKLPPILGIPLMQSRPKSTATASSIVAGNIVAARKASSVAFFVAKSGPNYSRVDSMALKRVQMGASALGPSLTVYEKIDGHH